ncbi:hypothetical protein [Rhizobium sp. C4]|uniref:hypothetical protein n=1 Tax=Rhizobium sp. C4 TaxID=1349800 RepID=UPI001E4DD31E|nr:hypothetical protein [Rhizobium sp. C4]MCD2173382.1 hypothetical protein [Rhizobium sp. C4]
MVDNRPAILIAEDQIFIALEAERILTEGFDCTVEICRRDQLSDALAHKSFDIVVLEFAGNPGEDFHYGSLARRSGAQMMFLTAADDLADVAEAFPDVPLVRKPFNDTDMRTYVERLLVGKRSG